MNIFCSQQTISQVDSVKYVGILNDSKLMWTSHLENLDKNVIGGTSVLFKLQPFPDVHLVRIVYFALVYSHLIYGILNWATANWSSIADLVKLNNKPIRSLFKANSLIAGATIYSWLLSMLERRYGFCASARVGKALI